MDYKKRQASNKILPLRLNIPKIAQKLLNYSIKIQKHFFSNDGKLLRIFDV